MTNVITLFSIKNSIALTNSFSDIASVAHHPAVFLTQSGTDSLDFDEFMDSTTIIPSFAKNSIALTNSFSDIASVAHHPAVFLTQSGTDSAYIPGIVIIMNNDKIIGKINFICVKMLHIILYFSH